MKRYLLSLLALIGISTFSSAQDGPRPGSTLMRPSFSQPMPTEMEIQASDQIITFATAEDFAGAKSIPGYYRIHVKSPQGPWMVTARLVDQYSETGYMAMPEEYVSLVSLREQSTGHTVRLSSTPQTIIFGGNGLPEQDFFIDLIVDPPFNLPTSKHTGIVSFQLTNQ